MLGPAFPFSELSVQSIVAYVAYRLKPFVGSVFAVKFEGKVREPAVGRGSVPVLYVGRNVYHRTGKYLDCRFPFFLIPSASRNSDEHLSASFACPVYVPVVAASRFERHVEYLDLFGRNRRQIAVACKELCVCGVWFSDREYHLLLEIGLAVRFNVPYCIMSVRFSSIFRPYIFRPYILRLTESRPDLRLSCIET